jgi:hypothetical protein
VNWLYNPLERIFQLFFYPMLYRPVATNALSLPNQVVFGYSRART